MYLQLISKDGTIYSHRNVVYIDKKAVVNLPGLMLRITWFPLLQRLIREKIHQVLLVENKLIVVTKGIIRVYNLSGQPLAAFPVERGSRPLRQGIETIGNAIFYGDYWGNKNRDPVNLYRIDLVSLKRKKITVLKHVRHIHFVHSDFRDDRYLFIGTGDANSESGIYRVEISSGIKETIAEGAQKFRAVSLIQLGDTLLWGSDSPCSQNAIYRLNLSRGCDAEKITPIDGPAYYSTRSADGSLYISTTIEDRRCHKAIIYRSTDNGSNWYAYRSFKKDMWPEKWFGYGVVEFPRGHEHISGLYYNLSGLKEPHNVE